MGNVNNRTLSIVISMMMLVIAFSPIISSASFVGLGHAAVAMADLMPDASYGDAIPGQVGSRDTDPFVDAYTYDLGYGSVIDETVYSDLDGDGDKDLLLETTQSSATEYCNLSAIDVAEGRHLWNYSATLCWGASFGAVDSDGDGIMEVWMLEHDVYHVLNGSSGAQLWSSALCQGSGVPCTPAYGDVDQDGTIDVVLTSVESATVERARAFNMTSGAIEWVAPDFGMGDATEQFLGQLDSDAQLELVVWWNWYNATATADYSEIRVFDTKTNTTDWTKSTNVGMGSEVSVKDFDATGKDSVLQRAFSNTNTLKLFGPMGTTNWVISSGTFRAWLNRVWNSDSDAGLELVGDLGSNRVDLVNLTHGTFQGSYYCITYPPSQSGDLSQTYPVDKDPFGGDFVYTFGYNDLDGDWSHGLMLMSGVDCSVKHMYKFDDSWTIYPAYREDIDGDGAKEFVVTTALTGSQNVYSYTYNTYIAEWSNKTPDDYAISYGSGWVQGNMNGANKIRDVITVSTTGVSLFNGLNGSRTTHPVTETIYNLRKIDQNDDGLDDIFFETKNTTTNRVFGYVMMLGSAVRLKSPPPSVQMDEDTNVSKAVDLQNVFQYGGSWGQLAFGVEHPAGTENVSAALNGTWLDVWTAVPDWNGNATITVTATVTGGAGGAVKARIPVHVLPVNDAPRVDPVTDKVVLQDKLLNFTVHAWDVEGEPVTFKDNITLFDINATTGNVSFTPTNIDVGAHTVNVTASDPSGLNTSVLFKVTVTNVNDRPLITNRPPELATEDEDYNFTMVADDPDFLHTDTLNWFLTVTQNGSPGDATWLTVDRLTGNLSGMPSNSEVGGWDVAITAKDEALASDTLNMTITVLNINDAPMFVDVPANVTIDLGERFVFDVNATDIDIGDVLAFSVRSEPASTVDIDAETGLLEFTPEKAVQYLINLSVTDSNATTYREFRVTVATAYLATLVSPMDKAVLDVVNPSLRWSLAPDEIGVTFDIYLSKDSPLVDSLEPGARVAAGAAGSSWKTMTLDKGTTYYWTVIPVSTAGLGRCASGTWNFRISDTATINYPPVFVTTPTLEAMSGKVWNYTPMASDPDPSDVLEITLVKMPVGMTMTAGVITWKPTEAQVGMNPVTLQVSDGKDTVDQSFEINVVLGPKNRAPVVEAIKDKTIKVGETLVLKIAASDPDGDALTYSIADAPAGSTMSANGTFTWVPGKDQAGTYVLKVKVSDGSLTTEVTFNVKVTKDDGGGGGGSDGAGLGSMWPILAIILILVIVSVVVAVVLYTKGKRGKEVQGGTGPPAGNVQYQAPPPPPPPQAPYQGPPGPPGQGW